MSFVINLQGIFLPKKVFTRDGISIVPSWKAKKLDEAFRNPLYNTNRNLLLEQLFWGFVFFLSPNLLQNRIGLNKLLINEERTVKSCTKRGLSRDGKIQ